MLMVQFSIKEVNLSLGDVPSRDKRVCVCLALCAGLSADVDLCSDSPINGLTALSNGTILIFKGQFQCVFLPSITLSSR